MLNIMRIISEKAARKFWQDHPDAKQPLVSWLREVEAADWNTPAKIRDRYPKASFVPDNRVAFDLKGNTYRLVVWVNYRKKLVLIKWIGSHAEYNAIDVETVEI